MKRTTKYLNSFNSMVKIGVNYLNIYKEKPQTKFKIDISKV